MINLSARLFAVVDFYDAVGSNRAYRAAEPRDEVARLIRYQKARQFDPYLAEVFLQMIAAQ